MGFLNRVKHNGEEAKFRTSAAQNKAVAKNPEVKASVRARAAGSWFGDKFRANKHANQAELEKHKARA